MLIALDSSRAIYQQISSTPLYLTPPRRAGLVLAYASMSEEDIRAGIRQLARALPASRT